MKRKPTLPATRPDWRDPAMPVYRRYKIQGQWHNWATPEFESAYRAHLIETLPQPTYKYDPTYNLRRRKCPSKPS